MKNQIAIGALFFGMVCAGCAAVPAKPDSVTPMVMTITPAPTPVSERLDEPLLPPFTPSYPCEMQNGLATISDETYCRSEEINEVIAAEGDDTVFIQQTLHLGYGCWTGINTYEYALFSCNLSSGARTLLTDNPTTPLVPSLDGEWLAYSAVDRMTLDTFVYKIRIDGSELQRLDTQPFPESTVGVNVLGWSPDGEWIDLSLWDGTEDGWHRTRLRADGSGEFELLPGDK